MLLHPKQGPLDDGLCQGVAQVPRVPTVSRPHPVEAPKTAGPCVGQRYVIARPLGPADIYHVLWWPGTLYLTVAFVQNKSL